MVSRLREKGLQEGTDCPLGPAALAQAAPRVRSGTFLASGEDLRLRITPTISDPQLRTRENSS